MTATTGSTNTSFDDPAATQGYADRTARLVPGLHDLHKMTAILLAEQAPESADVLVVGAGGGVELTALAQAQPHWRFVGVDPSMPMLALAQATLGSLAARVTLHHGYIETAPAGPFDAATCLLTMHFLHIDERRATLQHMHRRLKPGAPLVMAHLSVPQDAEDKQRWLARYVAFAVASGVDAAHARQAASAIGARLPLLGPQQEEALLAEAGFKGAELFYAGMAFRGWVAYR